MLLLLLLAAPDPPFAPLPHAPNRISRPRQVQAAPPPLVVVVVVVAAAVCEGLFQGRAEGRARGGRDRAVRLCGRQWRQAVCQWQHRGRNRPAATKNQETGHEADACPTAICCKALNSASEMISTRPSCPHPTPAHTATAAAASRHTHPTHRSAPSRSSTAPRLGGSSSWRAPPRGWRAPGCRRRLWGTQCT